MRAWRAHERGAPGDGLRLEDVDDPVAGPGPVVAKVGKVVVCP